MQKSTVATFAGQDPRKCHAYTEFEPTPMELLQKTSSTRRLFIPLKRTDAFRNVTPGLCDHLKNIAQKVNLENDVMKLGIPATTIDDPHPSVQISNSDVAMLQWEHAARVAITLQRSSTKFKSMLTKLRPEEPDPMKGLAYDAFSTLRNSDSVASLKKKRSLYVK
jgi:hypothetical protein